MIGLNFGAALSGILRFLGTIAQYPAILREETIRLLASRGLPQLRSAVPVVTGRLRGSFRIRVRGGVVEIGSTDPAAPYIRYRAPGRYGAQAVDGTLQAWSRAVLPGILRQAARIAERRIRSQV